MVESNQKCHKCNNLMHYVKEIKNVNGIDLKMSPYIYKATNDIPQEVGYNQDISKHKWFCEYCIPLMEKSYRGKNCSIERHQFSCSTTKNPHTGEDIWIPFDWTTLNWKDTDKWDDQVKAGWYDGHRNKYNFYEVFRGNSCQTCQQSLNQPSDKICCQQSQEIISKEKSKQHGERERERERIYQLNTLNYWW